MTPIDHGAIEVRNASRRFRVAHDRSLTLKETLLRGGRRVEYTDLWAVRDASFSIEPGEAVAIVGRNGSGKSTLLKMLAGIIPPHEGSVEVGGRVAALLELGSGFHPDFTGRENVFMNAAIFGLSEKEVAERLDDIIEFAELAEFIDMPVRTYSSGMQLRLAFAVSAHLSPDVLLLDEVLAVGDEAFQRKCISRIYHFRRSGGTLVFVSHDGAAIERICSRAILIDDGLVARDGKPSEVMEHYRRLLAADDSHGSPPADEDAPPSEPGDERGGDERAGWGTMEARIESVRLLSNGVPVSSIVSGDDLEVEMAIQTRGTIPTPNIGISISDQEGTTLFGTNTKLAEFPVDEISGETKVSYRIPSTSIREGLFSFNLAVVSYDEATIYHWLEQAAEITVYPRTSGVGVLPIEGDWSLTDARALP